GGQTAAEVLLVVNALTRHQPQNLALTEGFSCPHGLFLASAYLYRLLHIPVNRIRIFSRSRAGSVSWRTAEPRPCKIRRTGPDGHWIFRAGDVTYRAAPRGPWETPAKSRDARTTRLRHLPSRGCACCISR